MSKDAGPISLTFDALYLCQKKTEDEMTMLMRRTICSNVVCCLCAVALWIMLFLPARREAAEKQLRTIDGLQVGGVDMKCFDEHNWSIDTSVKAGLEFGQPNPGQRRLRLMAEWYKGYGFTTIRLITMAWECLWDSDGHCRGEVKLLRRII
jgi:hypothetical protein